MSKHNVELARRRIEAFNARDVEGQLACCDPSIEFQSTFAAVGGAVYHGHNGIRAWHRDLGQAWGNEIRLEPERYFDLGERTLIFEMMHGSGRHSSAEVAMPIAVVVRWRNGLAVSLKGVFPPGGRAARPGRLRGRAGADRAVTVSTNVEIVKRSEPGRFRFHLLASVPQVEHQTTGTVEQTTAAGDHASRME